MLHAVRLTGVQSVTWPSVILDLFSVLLLAVALYSQTATVIAIDRYWNHNYKRTGDVRRLLARTAAAAAADYETFTIKPITTFDNCQNNK